MEKGFNNLIKEIALEVSLQVVGESYYKWDSTSTYYPTLTFLYPRRSQIKLRLKQRNEEITPLAITKLKENCEKVLTQTLFIIFMRLNVLTM